MDDETKLVERIRAFNRAYMPAMNLLGDSYLGSGHSITQVRVIYEIHEHEGCTAAAIARRMNIDKSYLSRIIAAGVRQGHVRREKSPDDGRAQLLHLTGEGHALAEEFIRKSNAEVAGILAARNLSDDDRRRLSDALGTIIDILENGDEQQ